MRNCPKFSSVAAAASAHPPSWPLCQVDHFCYAHPTLLQPLMVLSGKEGLCPLAMLGDSSKRLNSQGAEDAVEDRSGSGRVQADAAVGLCLDWLNKLCAVVCPYPSIVSSSSLPSPRSTSCPLRPEPHRALPRCILP